MARQRAVTPAPPPEPEPESENFIQAYPAATAATLTGLSALVVWLIDGLTNVADVPPAVAATIAGGLISIVLLIAKYGLTGIARTVWRGKEES